LRILNAINGNTISKIKLDFNETILECLPTSKNNSDGTIEQTFIIMSETDDSKLNLHVYSNKDQQHTRMNSLEFEFKAKSNYKLAFSFENHLFFGKLLIETPEKHIKLYAIDFLMKKNLRNKTLNFDFLHSYLIKRNVSLIENSCFSTNLKALIIFYDYQLFFIDTEANNLIAFKDFTKLDPTLDYFLTPTYLNANRLNDLNCIKSKDCRYYDLICLNNLNCLVHLQMDTKLNKIKIKCTSGNEKYNSFKLNENYLLGFNKLKSEIVGILLTEITDKETFNNYSFKIKINKTQFTKEHYGFSADSKNTYVYVLEHKRLLKLYRFADCKKLAEILVPQFLKIICTNDCISLLLKDGNLQSYLICDPDETDNFEKIKRLRSSRFDVPPGNQINNNLIESVVKEYTSDEESDDNEIIEKLSNIRKFRKKRILRELESFKNCRCYSIFSVILRHYIYKIF
jgi:hypothetical protein